MCYLHLLFSVFFFSARILARCSRLGFTWEDRKESYMKVFPVLTCPAWLLVDLEKKSILLLKLLPWDFFFKQLDTRLDIRNGVQKCSERSPPLPHFLSLTPCLSPSPLLFLLLLKDTILCIPGWPQTHYVAKADLELLILLPEPPQC